MSILGTRIGIALVVLALVIPSGCSRGPSLQDYYGDLERIREQLDESGKKLQEDSAAQMQTATTDEAQLVVFREYLGKSVDSAKDTVSQLRQLDPPEEARAAHEAFVAAYEKTIAAMQQGMEASKDSTTLDDAFTALTAGDVVAASGDLDAACQDLQKVADDNGVDADLQCQAASGSGGEGGSAPPP